MMDILLTILLTVILVCGFVTHSVYLKVKKGKEIRNGSFESNSVAHPTETMPMLDRKNSRWKGFQTKIAGLNHHEASKVIHSLRAGTILSLLREPTNRYDKNAVRVYSGKYFLGYIPAADVLRVSQSIASGETVSAEVVRVYVSNNSRAFEEPYTEISIRITRHSNV